MRQVIGGILFWLLIGGLAWMSVLKVWAQAPPTVAEAAASPVAQLKECQTQNATIVQLWRDISNQRGSYEVQIASIRAALGVACPEGQPVSQCVAALQAQHVETAQKLVKATAPAAKPATDSAKK